LCTLHFALALALAGTLLALFPLAVAPAFAQGTGTSAGTGSSGVIAGELVNGTAGGAVPSGTPVLLRTYRNDALQGERPATADAQGFVRFEGLDVGRQVVYQLVATHAGVPYGSDAVVLRPEAPEQRVTLHLYETTDADPGVTAARAMFVVGAADGARQELAVMELITLVNPSDRTFTPNPQSAGGPMTGLVRFGLPEGARDLSISAGLDPSAAIQVDRGFASLAPLPPGEYEVGFTYRIPFRGERVTLEKPVSHGAGTLFVLAPETGPAIGEPSLVPGETMTLGGKRFRVWIGRDIAPGTRLTLRLTDLPPRPLGQRILETIAGPVVVPGLFAVALAAGVAWALRTRKRPPARAGAAGSAGVTRAAGPGGTAAAALPAALLEAIADLDDDYEAGRVPEPDYRAQRSALLARVRAQAAALYASPAEPGRESVPTVVATTAEEGQA
ncbi:MAG: hypothetical protein HY332_23705, partial [Chloroflexi bacterium]|nr:hypothetical protein [Chloroflexota bacterium]